MIRATDSGHDDGATGPSSEGQYQYIEALLDGSCFDEQQRAAIARTIDGMDRSLVPDLIVMLLNNQLDPVTQRGNYSQTEINRKMRKICKR